MSRVTIAGGGLIGLSVGWELCRRGYQVTVLERTHLGGGATHASAGMLAPVSEADVEDDALLNMAFDSLSRYREFLKSAEEVTGLSCGYRDEGTLWVAVRRDDEGELEHLHDTLTRRGLAAQLLTGQEVLSLEPHLNGRVLSGLRVAGDHQVDPRKMAQCLAEAIRKTGGEVREGVEVVGVESHAGEFAGLKVRRGGVDALMEADIGVMCAGAWLGKDIQAPTRELGLRPIKGQLLRLRGVPLLRHVVRSPSCYLVPRVDGELLVGATVEEMGFDEIPTAGAVMDLLREAWYLVPGVYDLRFDEVSVGLRPAVRDGLPVIGPTPLPGLYVATAHYRNGALLAPATAHHLAELIGGGPPLLQMGWRLAGAGYG